MIIMMIIIIIVMTKRSLIGFVTIAPTLRQ